MGEKAEFVLGEGLISTALLGGVWSAIELDPELLIVDVFGEVLLILAGPETAASFVAFSRGLLALGTVLVILGVFRIGRGLGLAAFVTMWVAGYLLIGGHQISIFMVFIAWGMGAASILIYTEEDLTSPPPRGGYGGRVR